MQVHIVVEQHRPSSLDLTSRLTPERCLRGVVDLALFLHRLLDDPLLKLPDVIGLAVLTLEGVRSFDSSVPARTFDLGVPGTGCRTIQSPLIWMDVLLEFVESRLGQGAILGGDGTIIL